MSKIFSIDKNRLIIYDSNTSANSGTVMSLIQKKLGVTIVEDASTDKCYLNKYGQLVVKSVEYAGGNTSGLLYSFGLLSDCHVDDDEVDVALSRSDLTNAISFFNDNGCNFIAYAGDVSYNGSPAEFAALKTCLDTSTIPNYCIRGNHDAHSTTFSEYNNQIESREDYTVTQNNDLLIFLSCANTNHGTGGLTTEKLDWLENLLTTNTDKRIFLFYHYFVDGTCGNARNYYPASSLTDSDGVALRFKNMVKGYPNLIFCSGHSHLRFNLQDLDPNANYYHNDGECYYVHVPSTSRPRQPDKSSPTGTSDWNEGSEGYLVEVYADKVIFKPIDFINSENLTKYNYTANVAQGD